MRFFIFSSVAFIFTSLSGHAAYTIKDGKLLQTHELATLSVQEHYSAALTALEKNDWDNLILQSTIVIKNFPESPFASEAQYYLAVGFFHRGDLEIANKYFSSYLKKNSSPKFFEEAIKYKFSIAEKFRNGAKKHLLGLESMPKWMPASQEAIEIYDEVLTALPHHELAIQSLFGKGQLLAEDEEYKKGVETFQILIRRFNKHPLACESYIGIGKIYLMECEREYPDPDFLDLAEINLKKFKADFPSEPRLALAEEMLVQMREIYANNLYETAQFYERTKKPHASAIYYNKILVKYPHTKTASNSEGRLAHLEKKYKRPFKERQTTLEEEQSLVKAESPEVVNPMTEEDPKQPPQEQQSAN